MSGRTFLGLPWEVRLEPDGTPWTDQRDPVMGERIVEVYRRLCETGETGRQIVGDSVTSG